MIRFLNVMINKSFCVIGLLVCGLFGFAQDKLSILGAIDAGRENLTWSIAGNLHGGNPNILSELEWSHVMGIGFHSNINFQFVDRLAVFIAGGGRSIVSGKVIDADYENDNRTGRVFFAQENAGKGQVRNGEAGLLYRVISRNPLNLSVGGGYGLLNQQLYLINKAKGLNSSYSNDWYGPLIKAKLCISFNVRWKVALHTTYHQVVYRATGDWNLMDAFQHPVSFSHRAKGFGLEHELSAVFKLATNFSISTIASYWYGTTGTGIDTLYKKDQTTVKTRLNDVTSNVVAIRTGVVFHPF